MHSVEAAQLNLPLMDQPLRGGFMTRPLLRRTFLSGKIVHSGGAYSIDCAIRNFSSGGAMITLRRHQTLPPDVYLIAISRGVAYRARVVWFDYPARGLRFSQSYALSADVPVDLKYLRHLWVELSERSGLHD